MSVMSTLVQPIAASERAIRQDKYTWSPFIGGQSGKERSQQILIMQSCRARKVFLTHIKFDPEASNYFS